MSIVDSLNDIFGKEDNIPIVRISNLLRLSWQGDMCHDDGARAMCWRVFLGMLSGNDKQQWKRELDGMLSSYAALKGRVMPSIDKVKDDPLSALSVGDSMSEEWSTYYKNVELINFLKGDLDRLFLTGLEDEYFQSKEKREVLIAILFIWSMEHPLISYRQGMHEILGCIMYAVDLEKAAWDNAPQDHPLKSCFSADNVEAYSFVIFDRIMMELAALYDPLPVTGIETQPYVVQFCTKIQEHYLQLLDPALAHHLEESFIQSQLYGLRWSRLLLGREFTLANNQMFRLWDFMFASCYDAEYNSAEALLDDSAPPNVYSVLAHTRIKGYHMNDNAQKRVNKTDKVSYVCTPLLGSLADCMLAMMIQVRDQLLEGDSSIVMATLMRYPEQTSVLPVIECADMIRRGVLVRFIDSKGSVLNYNYETMAPGTPPQSSYKGGTTQSSSKGHNAQATPQFRAGGYHDMGKKMTEKISQVGASISDLVQAAIAPMIDAAFEDDGSAHGDHPLGSKSSKQQQQDASFRSPAPSAMSATKKRPSTTTSLATDTGSTAHDTSKGTNGSDASKFDPNIDPLTGARLTATAPTKPGSSSGGSTTDSVQLPYTSSTSQKQPAGVGASTASTNPSYSILFDEPSQGSASAQKSGRTGPLSLFKPREWFSSVSTSGNVGANGASANNQVDGDRRTSGGFNMPVLHGGHDSHATDQTHTNPVPIRKKGLIAQNATVGDRLHDIADYLMNFSGTIAMDEAAGAAGATGATAANEDACYVVAKRLRALADVLAGQYSVIDYDVKYANRTLPTVLSLAGQSTSVAVSRESTSSISGALAAVAAPVVVAQPSACSTTDSVDGDAVVGPSAAADGDAVNDGDAAVSAAPVPPADLIATAAVDITQAQPVPYADDAASADAAPDTATDTDAVPDAATDATADAATNAVVADSEAV